MNKKILVLGISTILLTLVFSNIAVADVQKADKLFDIEVTDYNRDGSIVTRIVKLNLKQLNDFRKDIMNAQDMEEKHKILQKYNLIPKDESLESLKQGMLEKAKNMNIKSDTAFKKTRLKLPIMLSLFDKVDVIYFGGVSARLGTTPFMKFIKKIIKINLPGVDLIDICGGLFGIINAKGVFAQNILISTFSIAALAGFVGHSIKIPLLMHIFNGYSAVTFGMGLGIHIKKIGFENPIPKK